MIAVILIALFAIAILHFIYDGIVLPGVRQHYRNKLFALRDELRWEMIQGINAEDKDAFNLVHDAINAFANRLPLLTIAVQKAFEKDLEDNERLRKMIEKRREILAQCRNENIKRIAHEVNVVLEGVYIANSGGWFIYLIPIALVVTTLKKLTEVSSELAIAPVQEVRKIIPHTSNKACC